MPWTETSVWKLPSVQKTFISVDEGWFQTYVTDALESVTIRYVAQVSSDDHIVLLVVLTET